MESVEAKGAMEEIDAINALEDLRLAEDEQEIVALQQELSAAEDRERQARSQASEMARGSKQIASATAAAAAMEEAETRSDMLEEERARLKEELGTLRFSLKDMKSFQHRRLQELDAHAQRLEKQRRKLEGEQVARERDGQANEAAEIAATEKKIVVLSELNARLTAQVQEAHQEAHSKERQEAVGIEDRDYIRAIEKLEAQEVACAHQRLDVVAASEGALCRQVRTLRNQAQLLQRQVSSLDANAEQTGLQLEEAQAAHCKLQEESEATERRAEIIHWKLQVAETQLTNRHFRPPRGSRSSAGNGMRELGRDSAMSSDSAGAGHGSAAP